MEFYQLEAFVSVVAHRSFSRAAEHLYLSQPTVSAHVKSLEVELGTPLFDRGKSELLLTPAGETLYRYARDLLDLRAAAYTELLENGKIPEESLTLPASSVPCQYLLPRAVAAFERQYPTVAVSLRQENSRQVCEDVFRYHYALGVVGEKNELPHLTFEPILEDELVVAIPRLESYHDLLLKNELAAQDIAGHNLLLREPGSGTRSLFEQAMLHNGGHLGQFKTQVFDNQETIKQAVRQGLGLTVISSLVMQDYADFGIVELRPLAGLNLKRCFYLVHHQKRVLSPAARALINHLKIFFRQGASQ